MRLGLSLGLVMVAGSAGAVEPETAPPPSPTKTTTDCAEGTIWDAEAGACVAPDTASLGDEALYRAARELAYAGRYQGAAAVLSAMADQSAPRVLTYRGFLARKTGDWAAAEAYYTAAIAAAPDNLLARAYYGQGLAERGDHGAARAQLTEIRRRGGRNTWPEAALALALASGGGKAY